MGYFPFFVDIEGKNGLIIGGGKVALRKVKGLLPFGARLTVVAPLIEKEILDDPAVDCKLRPFEEKDIRGRMFVIAASDDPDVNRAAADFCRQRRIPVNVADDKESCSFLFPALVKEGPLAIGISTEGISPAMAGYLKGRIRASLPQGIGDGLKELEAFRQQVKESVPDPGQRARLLRQEAFKYAGLEQRETGTVILVGAGCGAYDLITLRGMRALQGADAVVFDDLIDERLLTFAGESCERIYVGKRSGLPSMPQEKINEILIRKAKEGKTVVRLKGGDPFVFGRGGEEVLALEKAGIKAEVIPGVSSATGIPAQAGIPITHRGVSQSFHVVTAHTAGRSCPADLVPVAEKDKEGEDDLPEDLEKLASLNGTLVFLMGFGRLKEIAEKLMGYGKSPDTPAAVVQGGFDGRMWVVRGCLADIAGKVSEAGMKAPAVILVGACVALQWKK